MTIFEQSSADIFIMDWERYEQIKPVEIKETVNVPAVAAAGGNDGGQPAATTEVHTKFEPSGEDVGSIAWRSLFIVNEFNELST